MALNQKYLERLARRQRVSQQSRETPPPKTVSAEQTALKVEAALQQQRIEQRKEGWRASAKWLEQNCEEFRQPGNGEVSKAANGTSSLVSCSNSGEPANERPTVESQPLVGAPESSQNVPITLPAPPSIPLLQSAFWQALLYGSRDALVSPRDANTALRLVACELGKDLDVIEFTESIRVNTLRKVLDQRFGAGAWPAMNKLWRSAPASPGVPPPNEDQSRLPPGPLPADRRQPRWIAELHDPDRIEREWLLDRGIGL
jgi:hypothetical protein